MQFLARIESFLTNMRPSEADVARHFLRDPGRIATQSLREIADWCGTSDATVLRTCRAAGFDGYQDLKYHALREFTSRNDRREPQRGAESAVCDDIAASLTACQRRIPKAVALLEKAHRVAIVGTGASYGVGCVFADVLCTLGKQAVALMDDQAVDFALAPSAASLLVVAISHSGETGFPLRAVRSAKRCKVPTIGLCNEPASELGRTVDLLLATQAVERPEGSFSIIPRICQLAVLDRLTEQVRRKGQANESLRPRTRNRVKSKSIQHSSGIAPSRRHSRRKL